MKGERQDAVQLPPSFGENADEAALLEEIRQLRAAIKIYRELVERLLSERRKERD
jgi:uncharacterized protein YecE (DUF72 family)